PFQFVAAGTASHGDAAAGQQRMQRRFRGVLAAERGSLLTLKQGGVAADAQAGLAGQLDDRLIQWLGGQMDGERLLGPRGARVSDQQGGQQAEQQQRLGGCRSGLQDHYWLQRYFRGVSTDEDKAGSQSGNSYFRLKITYQGVKCFTSRSRASLSSARAASLSSAGSTPVKWGGGWLAPRASSSARMPARWWPRRSITCGRGVLLKTN